MKLVKEHLYEKFTDESDPIKDMGIGFYVKKNFKNNEELIIWLIEHLPRILGTNKIPSDIICKKGDNLFPWEYFDKIEQYVENYLLLKDNHIKIEEIDSDIYRKLVNMGYPKTKRTNESFKDDTDPIKDMQVGMTVCPKCGGAGYYPDHDNHFDPETGEHDCRNCPIQVPCDLCDETGDVTLKKDFEYKQKYNLENWDENLKDFRF